MLLYRRGVQNKWDRIGTWLIVLLATSSLHVLAQDARVHERIIGLDEALQQAEVANYTVKNARADVHLARASVSQSRTAFLPNFSISEIVTTTNDPLNAFGFKLKQEVVTQADFNPVILNNPDRIDQLTTRFEFRQPVFDAVGLAQHRVARSEAEAARFAEERTGYYVRFEVKRTYFQLALAHRSLAVVDSALVAARINQEQACRIYEEGLITRADLLEADVRVLDLESKHTEAKFAIHDTSDRLRLLLGIDAPVSLVPSDMLVYTPVSVDDLSDENINAYRSDMDATAGSHTCCSPFS